MNRRHLGVVPGINQTLSWAFVDAPVGAALPLLPLRLPRQE
jgi:hypothetical protein